MVYFGTCLTRSSTTAPARTEHLRLAIEFLRFAKRIVPPETLHGKKQGAVIFGHSKKLPVNWPEDPEEIAQEGRLTPHSNDTDEAQVGPGHAASSNASETQGSASPTLLSSS